MEAISEVQPIKLSGNAEVQPSQNGKVRLVEPNLEGPKEGATQMSFKVCGSSIIYVLGQNVRGC